MKLSTYAKSAVSNLFYSWLRTLLAMLGIMIGTASVVALVSFGKLASEQALEQFKSLGTESMSLSFSPPNSGKIEQLKKVNTSLLLAMKNQIPEILAIAPYNTNYITSASNDNLLVVATNYNLFKIMHLTTQEGRFLTVLDKNHYFCIIGSDVVEQLKLVDPIGQRIRLGKVIFTIIGTVAKSSENGFFEQDINQSIIIPLELSKLITPSSGATNAMLQLKEGSNVELVKTKITNYFAEVFPGFHLVIQSAEEIIKKMGKQQEIFTLLLGLIGGISLLVGGIGVMNIMLASVAERRYEIGLRLALGAQPKDIQIMFLMEASLLAIIGGSIGVIIGQISTYLVALVYGWNFTIFYFPSILGFGVSLLISIFFGFYPAYLASQLNPIEALRAA